MSDQQVPNQTPTEPQASGNQTPGATEQPYITRADFEAEMAKVRQALDKNYQGVQARQDGFEAKVQQNLKATDAFLKKMSDMGITIDPANQEKLRQQAWNDAISEPEKAQQTQQPQPKDEQVDPITALAYQIMDDAGIKDFEESDPEYAMIEKASTGTEAQYLAAIAQASQSKKARLANPANPAARVTSLTQGAPAGNSIANINDPTELWELAKKKVAAR